MRGLIPEEEMKTTYEIRNKEELSSILEKSLLLWIFIQFFL
jgi:hypothetical protein